MLHRSKGSLPEGRATCHSCRRKNPAPTRRATVDATCAQCGEMFQRVLARTRFCSRACSNRYAGKQRQVRSPDDARVRRSDREREAPGLTYAQRKRLLAKWRRQGMACAYCDAPATTVDHVVPLVRGGTNYEGNLAPACKRCNSGKSGWFVIEWRTGKRLAPMGQPTQWKPREIKAKAPKLIGEPVQTIMRVCKECGALHTRLSEYCSPKCQTRCYARTAYRVKVGIPVDAKPYSVRAI